jgi:hypothetical protein
MIGMREAFTVGIVLAAKDMYSNILTKAQRDITALSATSQAQADKFSHSLATWQKVGGIGIAMATTGYEVAKFWEDAVATAGRNQANIDRVLIAMGDSTIAMKNKVQSVFHDIKTSWGFTDEAISESLKDLSGRLGDNNAALKVFGVVSAFARARQIELVDATKMLTTIYNQYGDQMGDNLSIEEKYGIIANKMHYVLKGMGGDWETLDLFLGSAGLKAKAAGQGFDTLMGMVKVLGMEGAKMRMSGASIIQMLDDMVKIRKQTGSENFFPTYKKTGNLIDLLSDIRKIFESRGWMKEGFENQQKRIETLTKVFGTNAPMVDLFVQKLDKIKDETVHLEALGKQTGILSDYIIAGSKNMETFDGALLKIHAHMEELKEMLGEGGIPVLKFFYKTIGDFTEYLGTHKTEKEILGISATVIGLGAEAAKVTGPILGLLALYRIWQIQATLAAAAQASLNAQTAASVANISGLSATFGATAMSKPASLWRFLFGSATASSAVSSLIMTGGILAGILITVKGIAEIYEKSRRPSKLPLANEEGLKYIQDIQINLNKPLTEFKTIEDLQVRLQELSLLITELQKKSNEYRRQYPEAGAHPYEGLLEEAKTKLAMTQKGYQLKLIPSLSASKESTSFFPKTTPSFVPIKPFQSGGYVSATTLALLHAGELVLPREQAKSVIPAQAGIQPVFNNSITIYLQSSGSAILDARTIARQVMTELTKSLKRESRRYA